MEISGNIPEVRPIADLNCFVFCIVTLYTVLCCTALFLQGFSYSVTVNLYSAYGANATAVPVLGIIYNAADRMNFERITVR